jgi:hypothetical protein
MKTLERTISTTFDATLKLFKAPTESNEIVKFVQASQ